MGKQKKDTLIENLVEDLIDLDIQEQHQTDLHTDPVTGSLVDFSNIQNQQDDNALDLDIDVPSIQDINPTHFTNTDSDSPQTEKTEMKEQEFEEDEEKPRDIETREITYATEMVPAKSEVKKEASVELSESVQNENEVVEPHLRNDQAEDVFDHTEKVDISVYNLNSDYQNPLAAISSTESKLALAENFKIAQSKIAELEKDNERLTVENEDLASAAETFRNKVDQLIIQLENLEKKHKDLNENVDVEKEILLASIAEKDKEVNRVKQKASQLESRLQMGVRKIKVRERELENRLELVKLEGKALLKSKDDMILGLKRQIDKLNSEIETLRQKLLEGNKSVNQKQEVIRKTVKTLRLALSLLEVEEMQGQERPLKKVD